MCRLIRTLAIPSAVDSAAVAADMSPRRLKRSVTSKMQVLRRDVAGNAPTLSTLTATPDAGRRGIEMTGQRTVICGVFRA